MAVDQPTVIPGGLTAEQLAALIAGTTTKGNYKTVTVNFVEGRIGNGVYVDFMEQPEFQDKKIDAVVQSVKNNLEKLIHANPNWPQLQVTKVAGDDNQRGKVLLINMDALRGSLAENSDK